MSLTNLKSISRNIVMISKHSREAEEEVAEAEVDIIKEERTIISDSLPTMHEGAATDIQIIVINALHN